MAPTVQVQSLQPSDYQTTVTTMGTVVPAQEVVLKSRVSGEIIEIHPEFTEGGYIIKNNRLLQIDPEDYRLALTDKQGAVANARYALKLELGHQAVAKREWELLNESKPAQEMEKELALRKPHLEKARADLAAAEAELHTAKLNLDRTRILAPFNAIVRSKTVDLGSQVTPQDPLAELMGTDAYRIQVSIPIDRLGWITIPRQAGDPGSKARIYYGQGHQCDGTVVRLMGDLSAEGRMARVLVQVEDPLGLQASQKERSPLLIGEYVRVEIQGSKLDAVFQIPRTSLRDNSSIWIVRDNQTLEIRQVRPIWRDADIVLLQDGVKTGEQLIISDLPAPVSGMAVRIDTAQTEPKDDSPDRKPVARD